MVNVLILEFWLNRNVKIIFLRMTETFHFSFRSERKGEEFDGSVVDVIVCSDHAQI